MTILPLVVASLLAAASASESPEPAVASARPAPPIVVAEASPASAEPAIDEAAPAPDTCMADVVARVQARYEGVRDLHARFEQRTRSVAFGGASEATASGEVRFAKPGRMRWSYSDPQPSLVVSDGETLWLYDPLAREAQAMPVSQGFLSGTAFQFLLGEGRILDAFHVTASGCGERLVQLDLVPKEPATYERLELHVDAALGDVRRTAIDDLFGNRTEVDFTSMETNTDPPETAFVFEAPEGVRLEVLEPQTGASP